LAFVSGLLLRTLWLDRFPGINGDECVYSIAAWRWWKGQELEFWAPTGRPLTSPVFWSWSLLTNGLGLQGFTWLRIPTWIASLATLLLVARGWRGLLGIQGSRICLLFLLCLPLEVVSARFAWDPSLLSLLSALLMTMAWRGKLGPLLLVGLGAGLTHPFAILVGPLALLIYLQRSSSRWLGPVWQVCRWSGFVIPVLVFLSGYILADGLRPDLTSPWRFAAGLWDLLSGESLWSQLVSREGARLNTPLAGLLGCLLLAGVVLKNIRAQQPDLSNCLSVGLGLGFALLYLGLGSNGVQFPFERNCFVLILPLVAFCSLWLAQLFERYPKLVTACILGLATASSFNCWRRYLIPLREHGSQAHRAFMCAAIEPRQQAFEQARQWLDRDALILVDDWWTWQPLLLLGQPYSVEVVKSEQEEDLRGALESGAVVIAYPFGPLYQKVMDLKMNLRGRVIQQAGGMDVLVVLAKRP
jgi:hypothetical protein